MFGLANCKQYQPWQGWYFVVPWLPAKPDAGFPSYQIHLFHKYLETISTGQRFIRKHINWRASVCYNPTRCQKPNSDSRYCRRCWTKLFFQQHPFPFHVAAAGLLAEAVSWFLRWQNKLSLKKRKVAKLISKLFFKSSTNPVPDIKSDFSKRKSYISDTLNQTGMWIAEQCFIHNQGPRKAGTTSGEAQNFPDLECQYHTSNLYFQLSHTSTAVLP